MFIYSFSFLQVEADALADALAAALAALASVVLQVEFLFCFLLFIFILSFLPVEVPEHGLAHARLRVGGTSRRRPPQEEELDVLPQFSKPGERDACGSAGPSVAEDGPLRCFAASTLAIEWHGLADALAAARAAKATVVL